VRFSANISILFTELPFLERFAAASRTGFRAVEFWWPPPEVLANIEEAAHEARLSVVAVNFDAGDMTRGDRGLLSDPHRQERFKANVPVALELAQRIGCTRLNALVGLMLPQLRRNEQLELARSNVAWAADEAASVGATILIEPLTTFENGPYRLAHTRQAAKFIRSVGRPNVKLQYDVYHMQRMEGNLAATISEHFPDIGHIQIADCPGRGEPGTGEINFQYLLRHIENIGYKGYVGLEYRPSTGTTEESLSWLPREARGS
jgi:hydroxypyruvate isomerase